MAHLMFDRRSYFCQPSYSKVSDEMETWETVLEANVLAAFVEVFIMLGKPAAIL